MWFGVGEYCVWVLVCDLCLDWLLELCFGDLILRICGVDVSACVLTPFDYCSMFF